MTSTQVRTVPVRGAAGEDRHEQVLSFWADHGALVGEVARARLAELVCLLVDDADDVVGVSSAYRDHVPHLGGRLFWVHRRFVAPSVPDDAEASLLNATFDVLEAESDGSDGAPVGLCVLVDDAGTIAQRPEAVWLDTDLRYAGYLDDGLQVRIRYFDGARIV